MNYESSVDNTDNLTTTLSVTIPNAEIEERFKKELSAVSKKIKIKGFRPGKAPIDMIKKMHGPQVRGDVVQKLISTSLGELIKEHKINYVGNPELDIKKNEEGHDLEFKANFAIYPEPEIKDYKGIKVKGPKLEVADQDVDKVVRRIQSSNAEHKKIEDRKKPKAGEVAEYTVFGFIEGQDKNKPNDLKPVKACLGQDELPPELDQALSEMEVGETKTIEVPSVAQHTADDAGVKYEVTLEAIYEQILPELTDAFVKTVDAECATALELKIKIREMLEKEREQNRNQKVEGEILRALVEKNEFQVPQLMIDNEIYNMLIRAGMVNPEQLPASGFNAEPFREQMSEAATERVKASIIVDRVAQQEDLMPKEEETKQWFDQQKQLYGEETFKKFVANQDYVQNAFIDYTRKKVLNYLRDQAKVELIDDDKFEKELEKRDAASEKKQKKAAKSEK